MVYWSTEHTETTEDGITIELAISEEDIPVRGSFASGDDAADKALEDDIIRRADAGDVWAWCCVRVRASLDGFQGEDYLGGCSYRDANDFVGQDYYYPDMVDRAIADLRATLEAEINETRLARVRTALAKVIKAQRGDDESEGCND